MEIRSPFPNSIPAGKLRLQISGHLCMSNFIFCQMMQVFNNAHEQNKSGIVSPDEFYQPNEGIPENVGSPASCRDRGWMRGRAGAWCLSLAHHDAIKGGSFNSSSSHRQD